MNPLTTLPTKMQKQRHEEWEALQKQGNLTSLASVINSLLPDRKLAGCNFKKKLTNMLLHFQYQQTCCSLILQNVKVKLT